MERKCSVIQGGGGGGGVNTSQNLNLKTTVIGHKRQMHNVKLY